MHFQVDFLVYFLNCFEKYNSLLSRDHVLKLS